MTQFARTTIDLTGWAGAPGVNVLNWCAPAHGDIIQDYVDEFYEIVQASLEAGTAAAFAPGVVVSINPQTTVHEVDTGTMVDILTYGDDPFSMTGSGSGDENRATQIGMQWGTSDIRNGRRVQGRTFFGPVAATQIDSSGNVASATRAAMVTNWSGVFDGLGPRLIVWSRPTTATPVGGYADVTSLSISQMPFVLRGRRN